MADTGSQHSNMDADNPPLMTTLSLSSEQQLQPAYADIAALDDRINALLRSGFGLESMDAYLRVAGSDAFREGTLPVRVMDAATFLQEVRSRQQDVQLYTRAIQRLKPELAHFEEQLANKENCPPDSANRVRVLGMVLRMRHELGEYESLFAAAQLQLWQLSLEENTRIVDEDAVRAELNALVARRLQLALQLRVDHAERLCAARAARQ